MGITVNAWLPSPVQGLLGFGGTRCCEFGTILAKTSSSRDCHQLYLFDSRNTIRHPFGMVPLGLEDFGNAEMDFASSRTDFGMPYRYKMFRYTTRGGQTCYCNTQRSSSGTLCAGSKLWGSFTDRASEVPQRDSNSAAPLDVSMTSPVMATDRAERGTAADERIVGPEKPSFSSREGSTRKVDHAICSDRPEEVSSITVKERNDSTLPAVVTIPSEMHVGEGDEFVSSNLVPENRTNEESSPPTVSLEVPRGKARRFSLENASFLKAIQEGKNLSLIESEQMKLLMSFKMTSCSSKGTLVIRALRVEQLKEVERLLTDSYAELMWGPLTYRPVLAWILMGYLRERQTRLPHAVTLVGLYAPSEETEIVAHSAQCKWFLAGAVEVSFNGSGQPNNMQTPVPPKDAPFLSNMAVQKKYRRRGIGWQLLKAAEQLAIQMGCKEIYLHCRMVDDAPLRMYRVSGYEIVATNSILSLLTFQRRRHLMCKRLSEPLIDEKSEEMDEVSQSLVDV